MSPYFASLNEFLHMGGYAGYVWPAYAAVFLVLSVIALRSRIRFKSK